MVNLESTLKCPYCGYEKLEIMEVNSCRFFYECENCKKVMRPREGDCCVFCSYGTVKCPSVQTGNICC